MFLCFGRRHLRVCACGLCKAPTHWAGISASHPTQANLAKWQGNCFVSSRSRVQFPQLALPFSFCVLLYAQLVGVREGPLLFFCLGRVVRPTMAEGPPQTHYASGTGEVPQQQQRPRENRAMRALLDLTRTCQCQAATAPTPTYWKKKEGANENTRGAVAVGRSKGKDPKKNSKAGNRTRVSCVTGKNTNHYTTSEEVGHRGSTCRPRHTPRHNFGTRG